MAEQKNTYMSLSFNDIPLEKALEIRDAVIQMGGATNITVYFDEPIENDTQPEDEGVVAHLNAVVDYDADDRGSSDE